MNGTDQKIDTPVARDVSRPVLYEIIDCQGKTHGPYSSAERAAYWAMQFWPDQGQDPDRTGKGWDIQTVR